MRNLRTLGIEPLSYGSLLTPLLTEKLPDDLKLIISRKFKNEIWNLEDLLKYFKEELHAKENCSTFSPGNQGWTGMYTLVVPSLSMKFIKNSHKNLPV